MIYTHGISFSLTNPFEPKTIEDISKSELIEKLEHSHKQAQCRKGRSLNDVFDELSDWCGQPGLDMTQYPPVSATDGTQ